MDHPFHLRYDTPATMWKDAMPLGNGRLGAMVYGDADIERIPLNDDSLWYGTYKERNNPALKDKLPEIQRLVLTGDIPKAEELIMQYMVGSPAAMRHYTVLGQLEIAVNQQMPFILGSAPTGEEPTVYQSDLDLMTGVLNIDHIKEGVGYHREMFISYLAQVMCTRYTADMARALNLDAKLNRIPMADAIEMVEDSRRPGRRSRGGSWSSVNADVIRSIDDKTFLLQGRDSGVEFAAAIRVVCNGELINPVSQLIAKGCSEVLIYLASATSNRFGDPVAEVQRRLDAAEKKGYAKLRGEHIADFSNLMGRCAIDLGPTPAITTDKRLEALRGDGAEDPALAALYFQFGRYLIVSGGREGSAALNLQGIWNNDFMPVWDSKYTININTQMNYWPVEVGNLSELHTPLFDLLESTHENGKETARVMYGMRGMVCHHNTDFYGDTAPQDMYMASTAWMTGAPWIALHIWEHYLHTMDVGVLKRMYPVLKDMCLFFEDFLLDVGGKLLTCPSLSPENRYILPSGYDTPICAAPAMDNQILRAFFRMCIEIQKTLEIDLDYSDKLAEMAAKLPLDKIGSKGQLLEWGDEYPELTPGMGHISHLFACYPGVDINWRDTPELLQAVNKSLELRVENGAGRGGWPLAWFICINARLLDGKKTDADIKAMLSNSTARSLLNGRGVFQIDGNLGAAAGIAECLLQSHVALHFLPALPDSWKDGSVKGFVARGGHEIDMSWKNGKLVEATVRPRFGGDVEVVGEELAVTCGNARIPTRKTSIGFEFDAAAGKSYTLAPFKIF